MKKYALITITILSVIAIFMVGVVVLQVINGFFDKHRLVFYPIVVFHAPIVIEKRTLATITKTVYISPTPAPLKY